MVLTWKTHPYHANKEMARICGASLPTTTVGGCKRICTNSIKYRSDATCQKHQNHNLVDADTKVSDLEHAGINSTKGSVECIDDVWYLVRNKFTKKAPAEKAPAKVVEKRRAEEVEEDDQNSSGEFLLPKKKHKEEHKEEQLSHEVRELRQVVESLVTKIDSQEREIRRLRHTNEYALAPYDPKTGSSGTIVHKLFKLNRAVEENTNSNQQEFDSLFPKVRRMEDGIIANQQFLQQLVQQLQQPVQQPVQQGASTQDLINALQRAAATHRSNAPIHNNTPQAPAKPMFGQNRYFGSK